MDNRRILKALIYAKDDQLPLFDGSTKTKASIDVLRRRFVLLFISNLDLSHDHEIFFLEQVYQHRSRTEGMYDIVWLPVVDLSVPWDETKRKQFETLQLLMPWYSVCHPSLLDPGVIRYIKESWHFIKTPLLVAFDQQGRVVNPNAFHMVWIWGSHAFPFTIQKDEALWGEERWGINLIARNVHPAIVNWIAENKYICLYGGEDIEWIRKFTRTAHSVAREAQIPLEMLYVGKSNPGETVRRNNAIIEAENLGHILQDLAMVWFFWVRIDGMWHSKLRLGRNVENDENMREIMTMISFDGRDQGWAMISSGSTEMARDKLDIIFQALADYRLWKNAAEERGFVNTLNDYLYRPHRIYCKHLILPETSGMIPDRIVCTECGQELSATVVELSFMYRCYTD
ncbi:hypothetical protein HS088_TW06G00703 [Tripterygium wilfordii]|uniref:Sieve element occlusion C-terminal domain-containing protein n=1 Tax=Tripterygium wilfordii TaxID=458696 RepID=A0A7J7DJJ6_TRIWF|nr:protein SIEVE ELEMENT OCCLUSION B-like [Tripterygium wilfordii]KAF5746532.1 hypothetical protein HS088_TW06G00703 [Tripterygium wilfordii]